MSYLKNLKWEMILFSLTSIAVGILMFLYPSQIINAMCIVLASILFIMGARYLLEYRRNNALSNFYRYEMVAGVALILGGIAVICCMKLILSMVTYIIAIIIIISGLMKVENAIDLKRMGRNWIPLMVFAVICIMLGISVLMMPMDHNDDGTTTASDFLIQASGIIFALTGLIDLITTLSVSSKIKIWTVERTAEIVEDNIDDEIVETLEDIPDPDDED